ncbi:type III secretion system needle complex protein [Escherichia coli]|nr:type III secretion system needle complex protein [Escherichia coli]MDM4844210.1 type III secretion system needle complex protein [Escherichia coli]MDM4856506.1 type III secretion system needle complex protein [Escherichia coli]
MADWNGYIMDISKQFDQGVDDLNQQVEKALEDLATNPSDPKFLAEYQSALAEYTLYRNAQSNVVKAYKDLDSAIIQNFPLNWIRILLCQ